MWGYVRLCTVMCGYVRLYVVMCGGESIVSKVAWKESSKAVLVVLLRLFGVVVKALFVRFCSRKAVRLRV